MLTVESLDTFLSLSEKERNKKYDIQFNIQTVRCLSKNLFNEDLKQKSKKILEDFLRWYSNYKWDYYVAKNGHMYMYSKNEIRYQIDSVDQGNRGVFYLKSFGHITDPTARNQILIIRFTKIAKEFMAFIVMITLLYIIVDHLIRP